MPQEYRKIKKQVNTETHKSPQLSLAVLINLLFFFAFTALFLFTNNPFIPACTVRWAAALSLTILCWCMFQLIWRFSNHLFRQIGAIDIKFVKIPNEIMVTIMDSFHLWKLSTPILVISIVIIGITAWWLGLSPFTPFSVFEGSPIVENFSVHFYPDGKTLTQLPGSRMQIASTQKMYVAALISQSANPVCEWSTSMGNLLPGTGCSTIYTSPLIGDIDTLTVHVQSACKTQDSFASLHIDIIPP
jgi:hypothetical protein